MKKRIVIYVDGSAKTVLCLEENPNNRDLNIHIASGGRTYNADTLRELVAAKDEDHYVPADKYISVHNGTESKSNNMIKRTILYCDNTKATLVQVTGAIKTDNLYTPALFRICGDLSRDRYLADCSSENEEVISLGNYNPKKDQLRFMVVVSDRDKPFTPDNEHPSNDMVLNFATFSITLIWSYFNQPSHPHAIDFFLHTTIETGPVAGFDWWQIYNLYTDLYMAGANKYFEVYGCE